MYFQGARLNGFEYYNTLKPDTNIIYSIIDLNIPQILCERMALSTKIFINIIMSGFHMSKQGHKIRTISPDISTFKDL